MSSDLSEKEVEKLAELSRINLTPEEKKEMRDKLASIIGYVDQIKEVSSQGNEMREVGAVKNILREDINAHESGIHTEAILANAPKREGQYVKVKKIL